MSAALPAAGAAGGASSLGWLGGPGGMALLTLAPMLFSKFFSGRDPAQQRYDMLKHLLDPNRMRQLGINQFQEDLNGPAFQSAQRDILASGGQFARTMAGNAARAGLETSGLGAMVNAGASSLSGINLAKLKAAQFNESRNTSNNRIFQTAGILGGAPLPTNYTAGFAGAGLNAMLTYLLNRQPKVATAPATRSPYAYNPYQSPPEQVHF